MIAIAAPGKMPCQGRRKSAPVRSRAEDAAVPGERIAARRRSALENENNFGCVGEEDDTSLTLAGQRKIHSGFPRT